MSAREASSRKTGEVVELAGAWDRASCRSWRAAVKRVSGDGASAGASFHCLTSALTWPRKDCLGWSVVR